MPVVLFRFCQVDPSLGDPGAKGSMQRPRAHPTWATRQHLSSQTHFPVSPVSNTLKWLRVGGRRRDCGLSQPWLSPRQALYTLLVYKGFTLFNVRYNEQYDELFNIPQQRPFDITKRT